MPSQEGQQDQPSPTKPQVVGIYGVPGSGKSYLLEQLELHFKDYVNNEFLIYEGSKVIRDLVPGGLDTFKMLDEDEKKLYREHAIKKIATEAAKSGKVAVVAGHFMLWSENEQQGKVVCTEKDLETYTQIIYLDTRAETIQDQIKNDTRHSDREIASTAHIERWQQD